MKTLRAALVLVLVPVTSCSRDEAPQVAKAPAAAQRAGLATVAEKPAPVAPGKRRVLELEGGVRVEVVAEGTGDVVGSGDEVALSLTLTYMPKSPEELKAEAAQAAASEKESEAKDGQKKPKPKSAKEEPAKTETKSVEADAVDGAGTAKTAEEVAKPMPTLLSEQAVSAAPGANPGTTADPESVAKSASAAQTDANAAQATNAPTQAAAPSEKTEADSDPAAAEAKPAADPAAQLATDAAPPAEGTAPAPAPLPAALEPVVVVSTRASGTPIRARVGTSGALLPGLSRAIVGLRQGTVAEITLPAEAAYGAAGLPSSGIPPNTPLHATIEIREVKR